MVFIGLGGHRAGTESAPTLAEPAADLWAKEKRRPSPYAPQVYNIGLASGKHKSPQATPLHSLYGCKSTKKNPNRQAIRRIFSENTFFV